MASPRASSTRVDRAIVLAAGLFCVCGIGLGVTSSVSAGSASRLDWSDLAGYEYVEGLAGLPDAVRAFEGKRVGLRGYLTPLYEFDDIHEFVLVASRMSRGPGVPAGISGHVQVRLAGVRGISDTNEPIEVWGTFRAVETKEQGYILSIYRIDDAVVRIR